MKPNHDNEPVPHTQVITELQQQVDVLQRNIRRLQAQMCWAALGMNLLKAHRKLQRMQQPMPQGTGTPA